MIGMLVTTQPLLINVPSNDSFNKFINDNKKTLLKVYDNEFESLAGLIEKLKLKKLNNCFAYQPENIFTSKNENNIFKINDNNRIYSLYNDSFNDDVSKVDNEQYLSFSKFDLLFNLYEKKTDYIISIEYNSNIYDTDTINKFIKSFEKIIDQIEKFGNIINDIEYIPDNEKNRIIYEFNCDKYEYENVKCYHTEFEKVAKEKPKEIAIIYNDIKINYRKLDEMSNSLGHLLRMKNVERNDIIPVITDRSPSFIVSTLAISKAGGAFLPIDKNLPDDRILYILSEVSPKLILCTCNISEIDIKIRGKYNVYDVNQHDYNKNINQLNNISEIQDTCYVLFTSGTTGKPKGTILTHYNLYNYIKRYPVECNSLYSLMKTNIIRNVLGITNFTFDIYHNEITYSLCHGLTIVLVSQELSENIQELSQYIMKNSVDFISTTPTRFELFMENELFRKVISNVRAIIFIGEKLPYSLCKEIHKYSNSNIYNGYGPTECTVVCSYKHITDNNVTIGKPISNNFIYILDNKLKPVPIGVEGEIYIGGAGVGQGYINRKELTTEKFIKSPFTNDTIFSNNIYNTGDIGKWNEEGEIIYIGRNDFQVKINGQRIELSEIENTIKLYPDIDYVVVIHTKDTIKNNQYLICYYKTTKENKNENSIEDEIKKFASSKLPSYMIPNFYYKLEELPLLPSGKLNRKALPEIDISEISKKNYVSPETETEKFVCSIIEKLFNLQENEVGKKTNLYEIGLDSMKAMKLVSHIKNHYNIKIGIRDINNHPVIDNLSLYIDNQKSDKKDIEDVDIIKHGDNYEFSMFLLQNTKYSFERLKFVLRNIHTTMYYKLNCDIDINKLTDAANQMLDRHLILKSVISEGEIDGITTTIGRVQSNVKLQIEEYDRSNFEKFIRPFNITEEILIRIGLIEKSILILDMNHCITDGFSMNIFIRELFKIYNDEPLQQPIQYGDYTKYYNNKLKETDISFETNYYKKLFSETSDITCLPYKSKFKNNIKSIQNSKPYQLYKIFKMMVLKKDRNMIKMEFELNNSIYNLINKTAKQYNVSKTAYFITIHSLVLSFYSNQKNIYSTIIDSNRKSLKMETIIGLLVRQMPFSLNVNNNSTLLDLIIKSYNILLTLYDFVSPPDKNLEELKIKRSSVVFKYDPYDLINSDENNNIYSNIEINDVYKYFNKTYSKSNKYDIGRNTEYLCMVNEMKDKYNVHLFYDFDLFDEELIKNIANMFKDIIGNESLLQTNIGDIFKKYSNSNNNEEKIKLQIEI
ncbi:hypothetical protein PIROE2DRAFT_14190 [Piromyces sp. E2]|nr:hypothetical protein PIROE2DRAFT_14190 [Piromyces sp. E2]|eukprot:OUM60131.1 hypothetical protein PIROE2DRAFT_14190 [Piromyces sp. E2]